MASFGAKLKQEREKRGVTLEDISRSTKIGTRLLRALEEEHFDQLPGGIFNKGFIRAYARVIGIDEEDAINEYLAATGSGPSDKNTQDHEAQVAEMRLPEPPVQPSAGLPWGTFAIALLIVALGFALWGFRSEEAQKTQSQPAAPTQTTPETASSTAVAPPPPSQQALGTTEPTSAPPPAAPEPHPATSPTIHGSQSPVPVSTPASSSVPASDKAATVTPAGSLRVLIKAREDSWISITVDGEVTTQDTLNAGAKKSVSAEKDIVIKAGNAGGLDFEFNGKKLPAQGNHGEVKTLTFDSNGLEASAPAAPAAAPEP